MAGNSYRQTQRQTQKQVQKMSQRQIQAVNMLSMNSRDLKAAVLKELRENPALELVPSKNKDIQAEYSQKKGGKEASDTFQQALESKESYGETLQQHLISQLNMIRLSPDEYDLSLRLVYNLDKNGFYGSMLSPQTLLDKKRPLQTNKMLYKCIERIQKLDPIGTCCKSPEESLFVQAKIQNDAPKLALFVLDGHLELINPPDCAKAAKKIIEYRDNWKKKKFAPWILLNELEITEKTVGEAISYILKLNPHPASEYISDSSGIEFEEPDIAVLITKERGHIPADNFENGRISAKGDFHFQVHYATGDIPQIRLSEEITFDKEMTERAKAFLNNLAYRQSTFILQACVIVSEQIEFFELGEGHIKPLTRRSVARILGIHESTVSRFTAKKNGKYFQTEWGLYPASYFFSAGVKAKNGEEISSEAVKATLAKFIEENPSLSDSKLCDALLERGIVISRRTVAKYRSQLGIKNSYSRNFT